MRTARVASWRVHLVNPIKRFAHPYQMKSVSLDLATEATSSATVTHPELLTICVIHEEQLAQVLVVVVVGQAFK